MTELRPEGRRFWVTPEMLRYGRDGLPEPHFNVVETAKFYFGMSGSWLRFRMRPDEGHPLTWLVLDDQPMEILRKNPDDEQSHRVFTLADMEPIAWSLYRFEQQDIDRARGELSAAHQVQLAELTAKQAAETELERNQTVRMIEQLAERHPRQRDQLAEKQAREIKALDARQEMAERRLESTVALVRAEAVLYGILPAAGVLYEVSAAA
jgi:hypothetical protein